MIGYGLITLVNFNESKTSKVLASFFVMPRYKFNLDQVLKGQSPEQAEIWLLASYLIESLRTVHSTGRTYNDLKPDNIMLSDSKSTLIDFGLCLKFVNDQGLHIGEDEQVSEFKGNIMFATVRQLEFKKPSRKDDLLSLGYMLIYLFNN